MADVHEAKRLGITGRPTFAARGVGAEGDLPPAQAQKIVNPELEAAPSAIAEAAAPEEEP